MFKIDIHFISTHLQLNDETIDIRKIEYYSLNKVPQNVVLTDVCQY